MRSSTMELVTAVYISAALGAAKLATVLGILAVAGKKAQRKRQQEKGGATYDEVCSDDEPLVQQHPELESLKDR